MKRSISILLVLIFAMPPQSAWAWSEAGHHIIAVMAFKLLTKEEQAKLRSLLEQHPRYAEDFSPPENLPNDDEKLLWRIGRTGYWPDVIRKNPTYDRPTWHYELGAALVLGDAAKLKIPARPGMLPEDATLETQALHISQVIVLCRQILADPTKPDRDRAIALCWIAHLVGDAHQPCHAGSLYMENVFAEEDGDRGANRIITKQVGNMHALWDQLLGNEFNLNGTRKRMMEISDDKTLMELGKHAISGKDSLDPQTWLKESRSAAVQHVYTPEVIASLNKVARGFIDMPETLELHEAYLKSAGQVAKARATQAAYRLAETWRLAINNFER
jgi:S1/P1 Nuclease